jgi:hypothetical protein
MSRRTLHATAIVGALGVLLLASEAGAAPVFLLDKNETTIFDVIPAWTQASACDCCVCWETALGTIFSYWDDVYYPSVGPWESLMPFGNSTSAPAFKAATGALWQLSGLGCDEGATTIPFWSYEARDTAAEYTESFGYAFDYDVDEIVWFGTDVADEIDADRPVYYSYQPEGDSAHAVTLVGYDAEPAEEILYLYKNWDPVLTLKGFDEATDHRTINITPGGEPTVPTDWICSDAAYEALDGCDCQCGTYDTDCDNELVANGCEEGQSCSPDGECVGCDDECDPPAGDRCNADGEVVACADSDADGCLELGAPDPCDSGSVCQDGNCIACTCEAPDERECTDGTHYRVCTAVAANCARWSLGVACPEGGTCDAGSCLSGAGGGGGASVGGGAPEGGAAGAPLVPTAKVDRTAGRGLLALAAACAALWRRRKPAGGARR